ncbi:MAG: conjugal transfer protein TraF [Mariprofundales bacterium]
MIVRSTLGILLLLLLGAGTVCANPVATNPAQGWFWYESKPIVVEKPQQELYAQPQVSQSVQPIATPKPSMAFPPKTLEEARVQLKQLKETAVWNPTSQNLQNYMRVQWWMNDKSEAFAKNWQKVLFTNPELDYSLVHPTDASAIAVVKQAELESKRNTLQEVTKDYGLFFVFRSDCPFCHKQAPILKLFTQIYGMQVLPISMDGKGIAGYPNPKSSVGTQFAHVKRVPALFLVNPNKQEIKPVSSGLVSAEELIRRITMITQQQEVAQ